ncbi:MAG TPA: PilZ domain-containing protein, partial [Gemmataceae bacterium]|nr:PilZ domain-containing protein [Gemmataceae bacterium]
MDYSSQFTDPVFAVEIEQTRIRLLARSQAGMQTLERARLEVPPCFRIGEHDPASAWFLEGAPAGWVRSVLPGRLDELNYDSAARPHTLRLQEFTGCEKRQNVRHAIRPALQIVPIAATGVANWAACYRAMARNLSGTGVAVLQGHQPTSGRIIIRLVQDGDPLYLPATIQRARAVGQSLVELGCRFQVQALEIVQQFVTNRVDHDATW